VSHLHYGGGVTHKSSGKSGKNKEPKMKNARVIEYRRFNKEEIGAITESLDVLGNLMEREKDAKMHKAYENALRAMRNEITLHEIGDENTVKCGNCATYFDERERLALESYADMVEYCGGPVCETCGNIWRRMGGTF
jgi:hypothetical protein